jgi:hypothetical protein
MLDRKVAEAAQFDPVTTRHCGNDSIENGVYDIIDVTVIEMRVVAGNALHKLGFNHQRYQ